MKSIAIIAVVLLAVPGMVAVVSATTTDEIGGYASAVIQESGALGEANISVNTLEVPGVFKKILILVLFNTSDPDPSFSDVGMDAYHLGAAMEKVIKHYPTIDIRPSIRINPNLNITEANKKAYLDMSMPL